MTDPDVPGPSDPYLREHLHWYIYICDTITHVYNMTTKNMFDFQLQINVHLDPIKIISA